MDEDSLILVVPDSNYTKRVPISIVLYNHYVILALHMQRMFYHH